MHALQTAIPILIGTKFDDFVMLPPDLQWTIVNQVNLLLYFDIILLESHNYNIFFVIKQENVSIEMFPLGFRVANTI